MDEGRSDHFGKERGLRGGRGGELIDEESRGEGMKAMSRPEGVKTVSGSIGSEEEVRRKEIFHM